jgi:hypothetical protein
MPTVQRPDDFSPKIIKDVAHRASYTCCNPHCRRRTLAPSPANSAKMTHIGVAAHITAASPNGPRYDSSLTPQQRSAIENAIYLCIRCATLIDKNNGEDYPVDVLKAWKLLHEHWLSLQMHLDSAGAASPLSFVTQQENISVEQISSILKTYNDQVIISDDQGTVVRGISTGLRDLNSITGGLQPGNLILFAGWQKSYPDVLALNIAFEAAAEGIATGLITLSMTRDQVIEQFVSFITDIDLLAVRSQRDQDCPEYIENAVAWAKETPLYIVDNLDGTLDNLEASINSLIVHQKISLLLIDGIHFFNVSNEQFGLMSLLLRRVARTNRIPIIMTIHFPRLRVIPAEPETLTLSMYSTEAGVRSLENNCDVICCVHRPQLIDPETDKFGLAYVFVSQRFGAEGIVIQFFDTRVFRFKDLGLWIDKSEVENESETTDTPVNEHQ